jgi:hypothetical protein
VEADLGEDLTRAADLWLEVTQAVAARALTGDVEGMLRHASDYLQATSILVVAWTLGLHVQGAERAVAAGRRDARLLRGQRAASAYWRRTELVRVAEILGRVRSGEDSYAALDPADL